MEIVKANGLQLGKSTSYDKGGAVRFEQNNRYNRGKRC